MITKELYCSLHLTDDNGSKCTIGYYLTKSSGLLKDSDSVYGISIEKVSSPELQEIYTVHDCFKKKENADLLLKNLSDFTITPTAAPECIDVLMCKCQFKY